MKKYNEENIRIAAYYNWKNAGCPSGQDEYFWNMAISQLYGSCSSSSCCSNKKSSKTSCSAKSSSTTCKSSSSSAKKTSTKK